MLATKHTRRTSEDALAARIASELDKIEESLCDLPRVAVAAFFGKHLDELELDLKKRILAGALRRYDFQIAEEVAARVAASPGAPVRILELAAGRSIPERVNFHYGAPYLSRAMKCVFGESADITVSDLYADNLDKKLERQLFGLSVMAGVDYEKLDQLDVARPFDFIFPSARAAGTAGTDSAALTFGRGRIFLQLRRARALARRGRCPLLRRRAAGSRPPQAAHRQGA